MAITELLQKKAEEAAIKSLQEGLDVVQIETSAPLILVRGDSEAGRERKEKPGAIAEIFSFEGVDFFICNS